MRPLRQNFLSLLFLGALPASVLGGDVLSTDGFSMCSTDPSIQVQALNVQYDRSNRLLTFDVAGSSSESQKVLLNLVVSAYGQDVYTQSFNPCDSNSTISQYTDNADATAAAISNMCPSTYSREDQNGGVFVR